MVARIKLGELLVRAGVLDDFKLKAALAEQNRWGGRLGKILVEMNFVSEDLLVKALSKQLGIARANLVNASVPSDIIAKIDPQFASLNAICPERYQPDKKMLVVAMADPTNYAAVDELRFKTGLKIETSLAGELEITQAVDRLFYGRIPIEGIELASDRSVPANPTDAYRNAMAASGVAVDPRSPTPAAERSTMQLLPPFQPLGNSPLRSQPPPLPPPPPPATNPISIPPFLTPSSSTAALEMAVALDVAQKKQLKALRVMLELLIEKGVFSRDEYFGLVNKR